MGDGLGLARQVELVRNQIKYIFRKILRALLILREKNKKIQIINIGQTCQLK